MLGLRWIVFAKQIGLGQGQIENLKQAQVNANMVEVIHDG